MLKNYLKTAFRNLFKNKVYSFINITGLSVGMAVALLIGLWATDELTFNHHFKNHDRIAQVYQNQDYNGEIATWFTLPRPTAEAIRASYGSNFRYVLMSTWTEGHLLVSGDTKLMKDGNFIEPQATDMLELKMLKGSRSGLKDPHSILLSASVAKAFFGDADPMGKLLKIDNLLDVKVTGVYEDLPENTSFANMGYMAPWELLATSIPWIRDMENPWGSNAFQVLVQVADNVSMDKAALSIRDVKKAHVNEIGARFNPQLYLHPMNRWRLYGDFDNGVNTGGRIQFVWLFSIIGIIVLLLACINFMNLSTARSEKRAKEVGIRKAVGSFRTQLVSQFYCESMLVAALAFVLCLLLAQTMLPAFNELADKKISIPWNHPLFWLAGIGFSFITGLLAGSYPALYLSSFRPVKVLKGTFRAGRFAAVPRRALVVLQFTVSVILIIGTLIVFRQIEYAQNRPLGYNNNGLVMLSLMTPELPKHFDVIREELKRSGAITGMASSSGPVTRVSSTNGDLTWEGKDPNMAVDLPNTGVSPEYGKTVGWEFVAGRDFSRQFASDSTAFVINESAAKFMGFKDPIGQIIKWDGQPLTVIGVIKDMIMESPYHAVRPSLYCMAKKHTNVVIFKLNPAISAQQSLRGIESIVKRYSPEQPFNYQFADASYASKFDGEARIGKLAGIFAILAVFISCLGLFGMAAFMAEQRTKEIGVRKVLGASMLNIWQLLSKEFVVLVFVSFVIAAPLAYFLMQKWLQNYEYRSGVPWWIFILTATAALLITLLTVSGQSIKAALMNPVKSLRSE
jgi:ABC-type antimicrobial peptide transport system permease subunit